MVNSEQLTVNGLTNVTVKVIQNIVSNTLLTVNRCRGFAIRDEIKL